MTDNIEVRTNIHIIADLLRFVVKTEWSGQRNTACHCHPEYSDCCPECNNFKYVPFKFNSQQSENEVHQDSCALAALIKESRAVIDAENELREKNGEDYIFYD